MDDPAIAPHSFPSYPLADLHAHLSTSISPAVYWRIAHTQGFKLPKKDYQEFIRYVTLTKTHRKPLKEYFDEIYHPLLDKLSSGTYAVEKAVYESMSGAYRKSNIHVIELRNNPMKHNNSGEQDLDHIIMAMLRGMERALLEYSKLSAGIIFCLDRQFTFEQNTIIVEKAIRYKRRGVVGIDFANYDTGSFHYKDYAALVNKARWEGLRVTAHTGENDNANDMWEAIRSINPNRIGHGIKAAYDKALMKELVKHDIVLEICPLSNLMTKAVKNVEELRFIMRTFIEHKVKFCINTDWPEIIENAKLRDQYHFLLKEKILNESELKQATKIGLASTFVKKGGLGAYL